MANPVQVSRNHLPRSPMGVYNLDKVHRNRMKMKTLSPGSLCERGGAKSGERHCLKKANWRVTEDDDSVC